MNLVRWIITFFQRRKTLREMPPRPFVDTPEAWQARRVVPGETREQARARLAKFRRMDG